MGNQYQLNGVWDEQSTILFMKSFFCREVNYSNISNESILFLKEWASMAAPFNLIDFNKIFDDFKKEFSANPTNFIKIFLNEIKIIQWPRESINVFMSSILSEPISNGFQVILAKLIRHYIGNKCDTIAEYETVRKMQFDRTGLNYFIENGLVSYELDDRILLLLEFEHRHEEPEDIFDFPDVYVSEDFLRNEEQGEILILINPNISAILKSLTLKCEEIKSFQAMLDILYNHLLINKVSRHSYGNEWVLSKYNGIAFTNISKLQNQDYRSLPQIGIIKNDILHIAKICPPRYSG